MKTKMKTVRVLIPILLIVVLLSATPVLAEKLTFNYSAIGNIGNPDIPAGASMSIVLKGALILGTPDYDSGGYFDHSVDDHGWGYYNGNDEWQWTYTGSNIGDLPGWVTSTFTPEIDATYLIKVYWENHEHGIYDNYRWYIKWYSTKGSWSGKLVAMWDGGTSPETWSIRLDQWYISKTKHRGWKFIDSDSWRLEHWWINKWVDDHWEEVWQGENSNLDTGTEGYGFNYWVEVFDIRFNGKFSTKSQHLQGILSTTQYKGWANLDPNNNPPNENSFDGDGQFGNYYFNFHS